MKHVRETLKDYENKQYFDNLFFKIKMFESDESEEKDEIQDKEKDALDIIKKINTDFEDFKSATKGEIAEYKDFWEQNKQTKELFSEPGNVYRMNGSDYVVAVLDIPAKIDPDGTVDGGLGAFEEEEEIIEGKPQEEIYLEGDDSVIPNPGGAGIPPIMSEGTAEEDALADLNLDEPVENDEVPVDELPPEDPMDIPVDELPPEDVAIEEPVDAPIEEPIGDVGETQTYLLVYDMSGGEREEIFRCGSTNAAKAFRDFYENTFKGTMKQAIQEYKEKKIQLKKEAEVQEKDRKDKEKKGKLDKFLGSDKSKDEKPAKSEEKPEEKVEKNEE